VGRRLKGQGSQKTCLDTFHQGLRITDIDLFVTNQAGLRKLGAALHVNIVVEGVTHFFLRAVKFWKAG